MKRLIALALSLTLFLILAGNTYAYHECWEVSSNGDPGENDTLVIWITYAAPNCDGTLLFDTIDYTAYKKVYYPLTGQTITTELTQYFDYYMNIPNPMGQEDGTWLGVMIIDVSGEFVEGYYSYRVTAQAYEDLGFGVVNLLTDETGWMEGTVPVQVNPTFDGRPKGITIGGRNG